MIDNGDTYLYLTLSAHYGVSIEFACPEIDWLLENGLIEPSNHKYVKGQAYYITPKGDKVLDSIKPQTLFVTYTEEHTTVREVDPNDSWDQGEDDLNGRYECVSWEQPSSYLHKTVQTAYKPGESVYVVWCTYGTGSTFSHTGGQFDALGVARTPLGVKALGRYGDVKHDDYFGGLEHVHDVQETL